MNYLANCSATIFLTTLCPLIKIFIQQNCKHFFLLKSIKLLFYKTKIKNVEKMRQMIFPEFDAAGWTGANLRITLAQFTYHVTVCALK